MNDRDYTFRGSLIKPTIYTDFLETNRADHIMKIAVICAVIAVPFIIIQFFNRNSSAGLFSSLFLVLVVLSALYLKKTYTTHSKIIFSVDTIRYSLDSL